MIDIQHAAISRGRSIQDAYDEFFQERSLILRDSFYLWILELPRPAPGDLLIDVATGNGRLVELAAAQGIHTLGTDLSYQGIAQVAQFAPKPASWLVSDGQSMSLPDGCADRVISLGSLEHYDDPLLGAAELARILKPDRRAVVLLPNAYGIFGNIKYVWEHGEVFDDGQPHQRYATRATWERMLQRAGLTCERLVAWTEINRPRTQRDFDFMLRRPQKILRRGACGHVPRQLGEPACVHLPPLVKRRKGRSGRSLHNAARPLRSHFLMSLPEAANPDSEIADGDTAMTAPDEAAATLPARARKRNVLAAGITALLMVLILGWLLYRERDALATIDLQHAWPRLLLGQALMLVGLIGAAWVWGSIMRNLGSRFAMLDHIHVYASTYLSRFLPGTIWYVVGRSAFYRMEGETARSVTVGSGIELLLSTIAGAMLALGLGIATAARTPVATLPVLAIAVAFGIVALQPARAGLAGQAAETAAHTGAATKHTRALASCGHRGLAVWRSNPVADCQRSGRCAHQRFRLHGIRVDACRKSCDLRLLPAKQLWSDRSGHEPPAQHNHAIIAGGRGRRINAHHANPVCRCCVCADGRRDDPIAAHDFQTLDVALTEGGRTPNGVLLFTHRFSLQDSLPKQESAK